MCFRIRSAGDISEVKKTLAVGLIKTNAIVYFENIHIAGCDNLDSANR